MCLSVAECPELDSIEATTGASSVVDFDRVSKLRSSARDDVIFAFVRPQGAMAQ